MSIDILTKKHEVPVDDTIHHWNASLKFEVSSPFLFLKLHPLLAGLQFEQQDLFKLVSPGVGGQVSSCLKWYFSPEKFPPNGDFQTSKDS
jgi:hypothetical protein